MATFQRVKPLTATERQIVQNIILRVCGGETISAICKEPEMPTANTVRGWIALDKELRDEWEKGKELRAHALIENALDLTKELADGEWSKDDSSRVRAIDRAISSLQWTAGRLNPKEYGERQPGNPVVPIAIYTTLALGKGEKPADGDSSVYKLRAVVPVLDAKAIPPGGPQQPRLEHKDSEE